MNRRSFTLAALLSPLAALPALAQPAAGAPRKKLFERSWAEMQPRQRARLLPGFGEPQPTEVEAGPRWDAMDERRRRIVIRAARPARN